jgi:hypothetical protein
MGLEVKDNIIPEQTAAENLPKSQVQTIDLNGKRPSEELISMIQDLGNSCVNLKNLVKNIKKKGYEEEFSNFEINLLAREVLRKSLTKRQLNYWFPIRKNATDKTTEESSSHRAQIVNNDSKKVTDKSNILGQIKGGSDADVLLQSTIIGQASEAKMLDSNSTAYPMIESNNKTARSISYFNLADFDSIDCTNHPMYQRADEKIEQLTQALNEKREEIMKLKEKIVHKT